MRYFRLIVVPVLFLVACASRPERADEQYLNPYALRASYLNRLARPVSGTFYVTYIPSNFTEPKDVREARHVYIKSRIIMFLEQAGLKYSDDLGVADYAVSYDYFSGPSSWFGLNGTASQSYQQNFEIDIRYNVLKVGAEERKTYDQQRAWEGSGWIASWSENDPTGLFDRFIATLLANFPKEGTETD